MEKYDFFEKNMKKLENELNNGEMVVLSSGKEVCFSADTTYKFIVNKNFYYYTGIDYDNITFILFRSNNQITRKIFFDEVDEKKVKFIGNKFTKKQAIELFDLDEDAIYSTDFLFEQIIYCCNSNSINKVYLEYDKKCCIDELKLEFLSKSKCKDIEFLNLELITVKHREIKQDYEIQCIKKAIDITDKAIGNVLLNVLKCDNEADVEAYFNFSIKKDKVKNKSFESIVASGNNARLLHYVSNDCDFKKEDLILLDVGVEYEYYASDISRTIPASGKFSELQKKCYDIVLDVNKKIIEIARPGITFKALNELAKKMIMKGIIDKKILENPKSIENYYYHSVSHPLGLDTHDLREESAVIKEGMVITVEPGVYIEELGIGIRIEDDIYISSDANIVLSSNIPKEVEDIEKSMICANAK